MTKSSGPTGERRATEEVLTAATLRLLERTGLLTGFTLSAVGQEAGVDRGLVYQYFGDRRTLLRAALRRASLERYSDPVAPERLTRETLRMRWGGSLRRGIANRKSIRLATILTCDNDPDVKLIPSVAEQQEIFRRLREGGYIKEGVAAEGFIAGLAAMVFGYSLFRERFAEELDFDLIELDSQVDYLYHRLIDVMATPDQSRSSAGQTSEREGEAS